MRDIRSILEEAVDDFPTGGDELFRTIARGRRRRRFARITAAGTAFVVAAAGIGLAAWTITSSDDGSRPRPTDPPATEPVSGACPGGWVDTEVPVLGNFGSHLYSVDAFAPDDVWVAGVFAQVPPEYLEYLESSPGPRHGPAPPTLLTPLVLRWDGVRWTRLETPNPGAYETSTGWVSGGSRLRDVSVAAPDDVWVVGSGAGGGSSSGIALHWDGTRWQETTPVRENLVNSTLVAVAAVGPSEAWAVAYSGQDDLIIEHWDGADWSLSPTPDLGEGSPELTDVVALAPDDVWAVGDMHAGPLALHWDGQAWTEVEVPNLRALRLYGVAPVSENDVWVVGTDYRDLAGRGPARPAIVHWDGSAWSFATIPGDTDDMQLTAIAAGGPDDIWVQGWRPGPEAEEPVLLRFDGMTWSEASPPSAHPEVVFGGAMDVASDGTLWYVGSADGAEIRGRSYAAVSCS